MVFQKPNPFPTMPIRQNALAGLTLTGADRMAAPEIVERAVRQAALWEEVKDRLDEPGMSLSGGQQQRLCIARALAPEPEVVRYLERMADHATKLGEEVYFLIRGQDIRHRGRLAEAAR